MQADLTPRRRQSAIRPDGGLAAVQNARQRSEMAAGAAHLIGIPEAAEIARVSRTAIRRACKAGDLPGVRTGGDADGYSFNPDDVRTWARSKLYIA